MRYVMWLLILSCISGRVNQVWFGSAARDLEETFSSRQVWQTAGRQISLPTLIIVGKQLKSTAQWCAGERGEQLRVHHLVWRTRWFGCMWKSYKRSSTCLGGSFNFWTFEQFSTLNRYSRPVSSLHLFYVRNSPPPFPPFLSLANVLNTFWFMSHHKQVSQYVVVWHAVRYKMSVCQFKTKQNR